MKLKNGIMFTFAILGIILALSFQNLNFLPKGIAQAQSSTKITLTNGDFNSSPTSYYLDSNPTGWTKINSSVQTTSGIINTNDSKFSSYTQTYQLSTNPQTMYVDTADTKILMINAKNADNSNGTYSQGYRSSSVSLSANSFYKFSILVKTEIGAVASIYLEGLSDDSLVLSQTKFELVSSTSWREYKYFISTGNTSQSVTISLWLGNQIVKSANSVFFDNVSLYQLSASRFSQEQVTNTYTKNIELTKTFLTSVQNANFESGNMTGYTAINQYPTNTIHRVINTTQSQIMTAEGFTYLGGDSSQLGSNALWLASKGTHDEFGVKSTDLSLERFGYYLVTVNVKVDTDTVAKISIIENDDVKNYFVNLDIDENIYSYEPSSVDLTITSNSTNAIMNNYNTYKFFIKSHSLFETSIRVELSLVKENETDTQVKGSALFDNIQFQAISSSEYDEASDSSSVKKLELTTITTSTAIANGTFNSANTLETLKFPLSPSNFTSDVENELENIYGIVNTNQSHYDLYKETYYGNVTNPKNPAGFSQDIENETNNILMMYNKTISYQSLLSDEFSVSSGKYYTLNFDYKIIQEGLNFNISVLNQDNIKVFEQEYLPFKTWTRYSLTIKVAEGTTGLKLKFSLGTQTNKTAGVVFVDNVNITELSSYTDEQFVEIEQNQNQINKTLDLSNMLLNTRLLKNIDNTYEMTAFTETLVSGTQSTNTDAIAEAGMIDGQSNPYSVISDSANTNKIKNIYFIQTHAEATYSILSTQKTTLSADKIYKISVYLRTRLLSVEDDYSQEYGAIFALDGVNGEIKNINTNDEWKQYSIIVNSTTSADVSLKFSLVSQNSTTGLLFIENIVVEELDSTTYASYAEDYDDEEERPDNLLIVGSTDIDEDDESETAEESTTDFNWLIIPSLLLVAALIFAVIGTVLRKIGFKKWIKKKSSEYDRNKTLYRDVIRKEAEKRRDEELKELNEQINIIDTEIKDIEEQNKERLAKQRREKGKKVDKETEKQFKQYASHRTKLQNKKDDLIEKANTINSAEYLLSMQKRIQLENLKKAQELPKKEK